MSSPWQPPADAGSSYWIAPARRSQPERQSHQPDDDFLLRESRGTRQEPSSAERPPPGGSGDGGGDDDGGDGGGGGGRRPPLAGARTATRKEFERLLGIIEAQRLRTVLNGADVLNLGSDDEPALALRHKHWVGLLLRMLGIAVAFGVAALVPAPLLALIVLAVVHGGLISLRRGVHERWGYAIGIAEFVVGWLVFTYLGPEALRGALVIGVLLVALLTVLAWRVDMELITDSRLLVRTSGLLLLKRTVEAPLTSIRIADVIGPFLGLGFVSVDTTSDRDELLHRFGLISQPNQWVTLMLNEIGRPPMSASAASATGAQPD